MIVKEKLLLTINSSSSPVFLRSDFKNLGSKSAVDKAIKLLIEDFSLMRVSTGIYLKARKNRLTDSVMCDVSGGVNAALLLILERLNIEHELTGLARGYDKGLEQIPNLLQLKLLKKSKRIIVIDDHVFDLSCLL